MIALFFLFLTLSVSPFKSKSRLEAENAALRHQLIVAAAQGARSRPAHKWGSLVLGHAVSMVSIDPQGHHDHPGQWKSRSLGGRPQVDADLRALIRRMSVKTVREPLDSHGSRCSAVSMT
jgi:hypothetical protein